MPTKIPMSTTTTTFTTAGNASFQKEEEHLLVDDELMWIYLPYSSCSSSSTITSSPAPPPPPPPLLNRQLHDLDASLRCPICHDLYHIPVSITPCMHTFCSECIRKSLKAGIKGMKRMASCPVCREEVGCIGGGINSSSGGSSASRTNIVDYEKYILPNRALENVTRRFHGVRFELRGALCRLYELENGATQPLDGGDHVSEDKDEADKGGGEEEAHKPQTEETTERSTKRKATDDPAVESTVFDEKIIEASQKEKDQTAKRPRRSTAKYGAPSKNKGDENDEYIPIDGNQSDTTVEYTGFDDINNNSGIDEEKTNVEQDSDTCRSNIPTSHTCQPPPATLSQTDTTLPPPPPKRKKKPTPYYHHLKRKKLVELCRSIGLSTSGTEKELRDRHEEYITLYNAECDAEYPRSEKELVQEIGRREKARREEKMQSIYTGAYSHAVHMENLKRSRKAVGEVASPTLSSSSSSLVSSGNAAFDNALKSNYRKLIEDARKKGLTGSKKEINGVSSSTGGVVVGSCVSSNEEGIGTHSEGDSQNETSLTIASSAISSYTASSGVVGGVTSAPLMNVLQTAGSDVPLTSPPSGTSATGLGWKPSNPPPSNFESLSPVRNPYTSKLHNGKENKVSSALTNALRTAKSVASPAAKISPGDEMRSSLSSSSVKSGNIQTAINGSENSRNCTSSKTTIAAKPTITGPWSCSVCTFRNTVRKWANARCEMCNSIRGTQSVIPASSSTPSRTNGGVEGTDSSVGDSITLEVD